MTNTMSRKTPYHADGLKPHLPTKTFPAMKNQSAFSLVEVTVALGIAAFCLTSLLGLIPAGLRTNQSSNEKCSASDVAALLISDLKSTPKGQGTTGQDPVVDGLKIPQAGETTAAEQQIYYSETPSGQTNNHFSSTLTGSRYLVSVSMQPPTAGQLGATNVHIRVTWPAMANPNTPDGALEMVTALNRN